MKNEDKQILLQACKYDPDKVVELVESRWSELKLEFNLIFKTL